MEHIYFKLIKQGLKTIEDVPLIIRDKVQALIDAEKK